MNSPARVSMVFQEDRLLPWATAEENVAFAIQNDRPRAAEWLCRVGLAEERTLYPDALSGGMKRRVAVARALAFDGDILLLDEPFKGLDADLRRSIYKLFREFADKKPVLWVTHDEEETSLGDLIVNV